MKKWRNHIVRALLAAGIGSFLSAAAFAAGTVTVDITVSVTATKSLSVNTTTYDFGALNVNVSSVSSVIVVTNDSGSLIETYTLTGANATSDTGGANWTLSASTGTDQYSLGAQFSTSQPANTTADWDATDYLTTGSQSCTATRFGNGNSAQSGGNVLPIAGLRNRNLWFRLHTPDVVSDTSRHTISITLGVQ